jgi:hypothetical protein
VPLFGNDGVVYLAGSKIAGTGQLDIDKALIVPQIEIGFCAIAGHKHLTMLVG